MRYFRVFWQTADGAKHQSDPLVTWIDAAKYRAELIASGAAPDGAQLVGPY